MLEKLRIQIQNPGSPDQIAKSNTQTFHSENLEKYINKNLPKIIGPDMNQNKIKCVSQG